MTAQHHYWLGRVPFEPLYVVSGLYPVSCADGVVAALGLTYGSLAEMPRPADGLLVAITLSSATLQTTLVGAADLGAVAPVLAITSASLVAGLITATYPAEGVAPAISLTAGNLVLGLVSTTIAPEALAPGLALTSGTLT